MGSLTGLVVAGVAGLGIGEDIIAFRLWVVSSAGDSSPSMTDPNRGPGDVAEL
jgi:hypothetical protein